jgi:hypothetical protein
MRLLGRAQADGQADWLDADGKAATRVRNLASRVGRSEPARRSPVG